MDNMANVKKPLIRQGWLRVLIFYILYLLLVSAAMSVLPRLSRSLSGTEAPAGNLVSGQFLWLMVLMIMIISVVLVLVFRLLVDKKKFSSLGFSSTGYMDGLSGFFLALAILGTGTLILYFSGHLQWTDVIFNGNQLFIQLGLMAMIAFYEEAVFRGYILNNLMESFGKWIALPVSAFLFTLFHLGNPGMNIVPLANIFLAGVLLGINYIYTKNIWFAVLFHFAWNFFQGPLLGYKVSGIDFSSLLQTELKGDLLLTGGEFGFEGSVLDLALTLIAILILYLAYEKKFRLSQPEQILKGA
jgi:uncharacterized protein